MNEIDHGGAIQYEVPELKKLNKLARTALPTWKLRQLKVHQGGLCGICQLPIDLTQKGEGVVDHDHKTGEIRGVLHRSCNAAEGKIFNAAAAWGAKSTMQAAVEDYLIKLLGYWRRPRTGFMYPMHKSADDKRELRNKVARERRATMKARLAMRGKKETNAIQSE